MAEDGRYPPIAEHGVIGDMKTVALVCLDGAIDFFCFPDFDSPTAFARLLDADRGGAFRIGPAEPPARRTQIYLPETNVLVTRFLSKAGIVELTDFMPLGEEDDPSRIVRIVTAVRGEVKVRLECAPAFDYARDRGEAEADGRRALFHGPNGAALTLCGTQRLTAEDGAVSATWTMGHGDQAAFVLTCADEPFEDVSVKSAAALQEATEDFWHGWAAHSTYKGRWREIVTRSALVLKLMISRRHGSMVAAPTFGLPEDPGGPRNWDYRFCWIRDSAFTIYALLRLGFRTEADHYTRWIKDRADECGADGALKLMYRLDGSEEMPETELDHLEGYVGSRPVRIGNGAADQLQLDIYGELLDSIYLTNKYTKKIPSDTWRAVTRIVDYVVEHWNQPDEGIWEMRGGRRDFLHSRLMCWVALDRALRICEKESLPAPVVEWRRTRNAIYEDVFENFWNEQLQSFVQQAGGDTVDAALLLMPLVKFISPVDPRWLTTLDRISHELAADVLVHRYDSSKSEVDSFENSFEGGFTMCSFWYVECLARAGRVHDARLLFEKMGSYANHLGLYSEELGLDGAQLGNFPQAFTHLSLISAAHAIDEELERRRG